jgi:hypothetical protein
MDPNYEELALMRAHEPGLRPPQHHIEHQSLPPEHRARRHLASTLRRMANRLDG